MSALDFGEGEHAPRRHTLLLRLAGPMQSWGTQSHFARRDTGLEPSKSGVVGLLCAALGRGREEPVDDLAALRMGVRVDHEGALQVDYQTAGGIRRGDTSGYGVAEFGGGGGATSGSGSGSGKGGGVRAVISRRAYLADARFLVGLEASTPEQRRLLQRLDAALAHPVWPLFLGRRAFVPAESVRLPDAPPLGPGLRPLPLREALLTYPWPLLHEPFDQSVSRSDQALRFVMEDASGTSGETGEGAGEGAGDEHVAGQMEMRLDTPISFAPLDRRYAPRFVHVEFHTPPDRDLA